MVGLISLVLILGWLVMVLVVLVCVMFNSVVMLHLFPLEWHLLSCWIYVCFVVLVCLVSGVVCFRWVVMVGFV